MMIMMTIMPNDDYVLSGNELSVNHRPHAGVNWLLNF